MWNTRERFVTSSIAATGAELAQRRQGDREKLSMALRLRRETTMTLNWIAKR